MSPVKKCASKKKPLSSKMDVAQLAVDTQDVPAQEEHDALPVEGVNLSSSDSSESSESSESSGHYSEPEDPHPPPPRRERSPSPDYDPAEELRAARSQRARRPSKKARQLQEEKASKMAKKIPNDVQIEEPNDAQTMEPNDAQIEELVVRRPRGLGKIPKKVRTITSVSSNGVPIEPPKIDAKAKHALGKFVEQRILCTEHDWRKVTKDDKDLVWEDFKGKFRFPEESEEILRKWALRTAGVCHRNWRNRLNSNFVQTGLDPCKVYDKITPKLWAEFVAYKTTEEAIALSKLRSKQAKQNVHHHTMGSSGYDVKQKQWKKEAEEAAKAGNGNPYDVHSERTVNWMLGRRPKSCSSGELSYERPETAEVVKKIIELQSQVKEGTFLPCGKHDVLGERVYSLASARHSLGRLCIPKFPPVSPHVAPPSPPPVQSAKDAHPAPPSPPPVQSAKDAHPAPPSPPHVQSAKDALPAPSIDSSPASAPSVKSPAPPKKPPNKKATARDLIPREIIPFTPSELMPEGQREAQRGWFAAIGRRKLSPPKVQGKGASEGKVYRSKRKELNEYVDVPTVYKCGKRFLSHEELSQKGFAMKRFHKWYLKASERGLTHVCAQVPYDCFFIEDQAIVVAFSDMWELFHLEKLNQEIIRLWCLMQYHDVSKTPNRWKVGFLDPLKIAKRSFSPELKPKNKEKGLSEEEFVKQKQMEGAQKTEVVEYITKVFLHSQDKDEIRTAYNTGDHYICLIISPKKWGQIVIFNSLADYPKDSYQDIIDLIQAAYKKYVDAGGEHNPKHKDKMYITVHPWCHKQPPGSVLCGYYVCEFLRVNGRYIVNSEDHEELHPTDRPLGEKDLLKIQEDTTHFLMREVIHKEGLFYDGFSRMGLQEEYYHDLVLYDRSKLFKQTHMQEYGTPGWLV
ncbi:hypothetical protein ACP70R_036827 [Stipagrostis hirtigluma subsp. patula]